ncbi:MAG: sigma-54 interaction domain-containing protein [Spirochaetia bacterium]
MIEIIGNNPVIKYILEQIEKVAALDIAVLLSGESGTGKDLFAQLVHEKSNASGPFIPVNTGAIAKELIASELFGHEKGAFTGASYMQKGKFELANGGTLFLDEISTMGMECQISLLRVLETKRIQRVGGSREIPVDTRVVAATNESLEELIKGGNFREDLYHRLNVFQFQIPPLRERGDDIHVLTDYFFQKYSKEFGKEIATVSKDFRNSLEQYPWPGNIRELENMVMRVCITSPDGNITPDLLPDYFRKNDKAKKEFVIPVGTSLDDTEKKLIKETLEYYGGNKSEAAEALKISRKALYNKLEAYRLKD